MRKIRFFGFSIGIEWFLLGLIVVAGVFLGIEALNHLTKISPDGFAYVYHASGILQGEVGFERRGPLFQCLLILIYTIFGVSFQSSVLIPLFFGSIIPILLFLVGKRLFDSETGLLAALIGTLNPLLTNLSVWVLRETFSVALILVFVLVVHFSFKTSSSRKSLIASFLSGVISGLIILTREEMIIVIPTAYLAYLFFTEKRKSIFAIKAIIFVMTTLLVMLPWLSYSLDHFGNPFYSYTVYTDHVGSATARGIAGATTAPSTAPFFITIPKAFFFGLWRLTIELPMLFSIFTLAFLPVGIIFTLKKRDVWILYFILVVDLILVSYLASLPWYFHREIMAPPFSDTIRFFFSAAMPFSVIIAAGIRKLFPLLKNFKPESVSVNQKVNQKAFYNSKIWRHPLSKIFSVKTFTIISLLVVALASYIPAYIITFENFDQISNRPFAQAAEYLNSIDGKPGVFTAQTDLLAKYYDGPIRRLPEKGDFELIREEALRKGVKYILIESTSVTSLELIRLYYKSVNPKWAEIPSDFVLVESNPWIYGLFFIQTEVRFDAAILGTTASWENNLATMGGSIKSFDDQISLLNLDLSEFDVVVFSDFRRALNDTERRHLEAAIGEGLTVIVSGLSPYFLAGGTRDLTPISSWFGATEFSEAPKDARWTAKFTEDAINIESELDLDYEYAFYTNSDWSTPIGTRAESESVVYAYRVDDQLATIFAHDFMGGTSIFVGPRFGFDSPDSIIFRQFIQSLVITYLSK